MRNWSGHVEFAAPSIAAPSTVSDLQSLVERMDPTRRFRNRTLDTLLASS